MRDHLLEKARVLVKEGVCDHCLGRQFAGRESGDFEEIGRKIRSWAGGDDGNLCILCGGIFDRLDELSRKGIDALKEYEFETFMVGSRMDRILEALEECLHEFLEIGTGVLFKVHFNREIEKRISAFYGKRVSRNPDITLIYNLSDFTVDLQIKPLYIYGRYRKLVRGIPQTRWHCRECRGRGCEKCNFTGKMYEVSVEELISEPFLELTGGKGAKLHGAGREDIDARMLGDGRPFVLEIENPRRRRVDLDLAEDIIRERSGGKVEVLGLRYAQGNEVRKLKSSRYRKKYRVLVEFEKEVNMESLKNALEGLKERTIEQKTPTRVLHRRADRMRKRKVYQIDVLSMTGLKAELVIEADSGLYIKELISGDEGRTKPSLTELMGVACRVEELDVVEVEGGL